jgi:phosphatidylserine/phosphatidylglycerophosphate/cardiolipin synthase-like enzyme
MAKESTTENSNPQEPEKTSISSSNKTKGDRLFSTLAVIVVIILGVYFLFTGSDPLGLFTEILATPTVNVTTHEWWQVYFTDPHTINDPENLSGSIPEKLIEHIDNAQESIHIAAFEFNLTPVAEALIAAHDRGVEVQWITDDEHGLEADEEDDHGQFAMLEKAGIEVIDDGRSALMHNKFWIFDGETVWSGSTNITQNGGFRNNNNAIVIESPELAAIYKREFQEMWGGEFGPKSPSTLDQQSVTIQGTPIQVMFSPDDDVMDGLVPYIQAAEDNIRIMAFAFTHSELADAILERAQAGVDVKGIFEKRGSETEYSVMPDMYCEKIAVRQDGNPRTFHHKVIIVDGKTVITGSLNFSYNADYRNDENTMIISNPDIAALYMEEFDRRWAEAVDPDPEDMKCK